MFRTAPRWQKWPLFALVFSLSALVLTACGDTPSNTVFTPAALPALQPSNTPVPATPLAIYPGDTLGKTGVSAEITGGGSTLGEPVYTRWIDKYKQVSAGVKLSYQPTGSGNGRAAFQGTPIPTNAAVTKPTVPLDFAGSDVPFTGEQLNTLVNGKGEVVHIPTVIGGIAVAYRLDNYKGDLRLSGPTLAKIFLGDIKDWSDKAIADDNGGAAIPAKPISVVIRSRTGSSGTSEIFTRFLAVVSSDFRDRVGPGSTPKWPTFNQLEGGSNDEVAATIGGRDGAIGYVDAAAAEGKNLGIAAIRNRTGRYIKPTADTLTAAAQAASVPDDFRTFTVYAPGEISYPITSFTWIIVWKDLGTLPNATPEKAQAIANFLWWSLHDGQKAENLPAGYAPLPTSLVQRLEGLFINNLDQKKIFQFKGQPLNIAKS